MKASEARELADAINDVDDITLETERVIRENIESAAAEGKMCCYPIEANYMHNVKYIVSKLKADGYNVKCHIYHTLYALNCNIFCEYLIDWCKANEKNWTEINSDIRVY